MASNNDFLSSLESGGWSLLQEEQIEQGDFIHRNALPYINDPKAWKQFHNPVLYETEVRLRNFIEEMSHDNQWRKDKYKRTYTFKMLFELLYGREYDGSKGKDCKYVYVLTKLFAYYSTSIKKDYYDRERGKARNKTCYVLSTKGHEKPPYSLKLRLEWLEAKGELPNFSNMKLPKDDLKPGHARNPKTEANKERRRQLARERYNEYQRQRKQRITEEQQALSEAGRCDDGSVSDDDAAGTDDWRGSQDEGDS